MTDVSIPAGEIDMPSQAARKSFPLTGLRGAIARNMVQGWQAPRVSMFAEADMTQYEQHRTQLQRAVGSTTKITATAYVLRALSLTLKKHPRLNATLRDNAVELIDDVNIALAVSVDDGLMAPVLRQADKRSLQEIAQQSAELAAGARANKLSPRSYQGGTFTLTNLGMTSIDWFTPIINPPQLGILGVSRIIQKPVVRNGEIVIAPMMGMTLVFDHRAIDGYPAAMFLSDLKARLASCEEL